MSIERSDDQIGSQQALKHVHANVAGAEDVERRPAVDPDAFQRGDDQLLLYGVEVDLILIPILLRSEGADDEGSQRFFRHLSPHFQMKGPKCSRRTFSVSRAELLADVRARKPMSPPPSARTDTAAGGLRLGQRVRHAKFGEGVVLDLEGLDEHARVQVNFERAGTKWLIAAYAGLRAV
ncbi:MAG: hypothetical protein ACREA0_05490 [bacterium]